MEIESTSCDKLVILIFLASDVWCSLISLEFSLTSMIFATSCTELSFLQSLISLEQLEEAKYWDFTCLLNKIYLSPFKY